MRGDEGLGGGRELVFYVKSEEEEEEGEGGWELLFSLFFSRIFCKNTKLRGWEWGLTIVLCPHTLLLLCCFCVNLW